MMQQLDILRRGYGKALGYWRDYSPGGRKIARKRAHTEQLLESMARGTIVRFDGNVLVDGSFDNPNFWLRYSLLRSALGLARGREIGAIGPYRRGHVRSSFARLGISKVLDMAVPPRERGRAAAEAEALLARARTAEDVLAWKLPCNVNPVILYDSILKRQRRAVVDVTQPDIRALTHEAVANIHRLEEVLDEAKPDLVIMSHTVGMICGPLAYLAAARGIPVVLVFGLFGALRFARFSTTDDLLSFYDRPTREEIDALPPAQAEAMAEAGRAYLSRRLGGKADDLASVYAFQRSKGAIDRAEICARYGWDEKIPIVAFYGSNWFDWPHQLGMTQFRDFLDWTEATFAVAYKHSRVNWLFKPHPTEDWFGGVALAEIVKQLGSAPHIAVSDKTWNNTEVMRAVDALVTYHGTAGIEFASLRKPVLVPDRGKYEDCGFVRVADSRADYLDLLQRPWWENMDLDDVKRRAEIFAGWWFCAPSWQKQLILPDDSRQDALYDLIPSLLGDNPSEVMREIDTLRGWWASGHRYYHTWKMARADAYQLSNV